MVGSNVVIDAFTDLAPRYEAAMDRELRELWGLSYKGFLDRLVETVPVDGSHVILDVATGTAQIPLTLASLEAPSRAMIGLDITPAMLLQGQANIEASGLNPKVKLVLASAMGMPFAESTVDVVVCGLGMHHLDVPRALSEIRRVLRIGGQIVIACVGAPSLWRSSIGGVLIRGATFIYSQANKSARAQAEAEAVPNIRTVTEWQELLSDFGFAAIEIVTRFTGRRLWYPGALLLRGVKSVG